MAEGDADDAPAGAPDSKIIIAAHGKIGLGRPWRAYSRVIYINTVLPAEINPAGWNNWAIPPTSPPPTTPNPTPPAPALPLHPRALVAPAHPRRGEAIPSANLPRRPRPLGPHRRSRQAPLTLPSWLARPEKVRRSASRLPRNTSYTRAIPESPYPKLPPSSPRDPKERRPRTMPRMATATQELLSVPPRTSGPGNRPR